MGRAPCCDKNGLKKGPWTQEEDHKLIDYIQKHGYGNWRTLPKNAGLQRCGKSCRLRWTNYLRPDIKRGRFSFEEEETIIQLHSILGNKWSIIASRLPGRTDNEIKNYWNTHIRKRLLRMGIDPVTHSPRLDLLDLSSILSSSSLYASSSQTSNSINIQRLLNGLDPLQLNPEHVKLASSLVSMSHHQPQNLSFCPQSGHDDPLFQAEQMPSSSTSTFVDPYPSDSNFISYVPYQFPSYGCYSNSSDHIIHQSGFMDPPPLISETEASTFQCSNIYSKGQNFGFGSVISTPSSSPTPLNSNSTCTEDERDSYGGGCNVMNLEISDVLGVNEFM